MRQLLGILSLLVATAIPVAAANGTGGFIGHVYDANGRPLNGAQVAFFRLPLHYVDSAVATVTTDGQGYYSKLALQPGRYMVAVATSHRAGDCRVDDVFDNGVTRENLRVHPGTECSGPRLHTSMVNPAITGDYTLVH